MFENPRRGRQATKFTTNVPKILDLKSSSEQIFSENCRWVPLKEEIIWLRSPFVTCQYPEGFRWLTRRCVSVYLGVVVLRVWYFEHALLHLKNCHHILPEKTNPLLHLFAEPHSLYSMSQSTTKIVSFHDNVWNMHIFNADMLGAKLQHRA